MTTVSFDLPGATYLAENGPKVDHPAGFNPQVPVLKTKGFHRSIPRRGPTRQQPSCSQASDPNPGNSGKSVLHAWQGGQAKSSSAAPKAEQEPAAQQTPANDAGTLQALEDALLLELPHTQQSSDSSQPHEGFKLCLSARASGKNDEFLSTGDFTLPSLNSSQLLSKTSLFWPGPWPDDDDFLGSAFTEPSPKQRSRMLWNRHRDSLETTRRTIARQMDSDQSTSTETRVLNADNTQRAFGLHQ